MNRRVKGILYFSSQADRNSAKTELEAFLADKQKLDARLTASDKWERGSAWILECDIRFVKALDGDNLRARIKQRMAQANVIRAQVSIHDCYHDTKDPQPCTQRNYEVDVK